MGMPGRDIRLVPHSAAETHEAEAQIQEAWAACSPTNARAMESTMAPSVHNATSGELRVVHRDLAGCSGSS